MKVKEFIQSVKNELAEIVSEGEVDAHLRILIDHFLNLNRAELQLKANEEIDENQADKIKSALEELKTNKPIDYIIQESIFLGYPFFVDESVLIPRAETEELVMMIVEREREATTSILDIGTGSGCIPIGLALERNYTSIDACEISKEALQVAQKNAAKLSVKVNFFELDILNQLPSKKYEVVVSNPPYVKQEEIEGLDAHVKEFEPLIALTPFDEPLLFYRRMIAIADQILLPNGRLYWEIHEDLGNEVCQLFTNTAFEEVKLHQDMFGRDRFVTAVYYP